MKLYMCVSKDKYELPLAVADTPTELARMLGLNTNSVHSALRHAKEGKAKHSRYKEVEVEDDID